MNQRRQNVSQAYLTLQRCRRRRQAATPRRRHREGVFQQRAAARAEKRAIVVGPPLYFCHQRLTREEDSPELRCQRVPQQGWRTARAPCDEARRAPELPHAWT